METYIGTKIVNAEPMNSFDFARYKMGGLITSDSPIKEGYKVEYEDGYVSWSPKETFERAYRKVTDSEKLLLSNQ